MGGPAFNEPGGDFVPGMYLRKGYTITSRGCHNRCWFCSVPKREGYQIRELPVRDGWIIADDNLLACSEQHINEVFAMLRRQPQRPEFTGGLEAKLLTPAMAEQLMSLRPKSLFFAYDTPDDYEPLRYAGRYLREAGLKTNHDTARCYVLCGYPRDTFQAAEKRMHDTFSAGFAPFAMLYRDKHGHTASEWRQFQRQWASPTILFSNLKKWRDKWNVI
jgi:hypothetical protein